jgi:hypothetical protein
MSEIVLETQNQGENRIMNHTLRNFTGAILAISALFVQDTRAGVAQPSGIANVTVPGGLGRTEFFGMPLPVPWSSQEQSTPQAALPGMQLSR